MRTKKPIETNIPVNILPCFRVYVYKDMELADEVEYCNTYKTYKLALKEFKSERAKAKGNYFVELKFCLEYEYINKNGYKSFKETDETELADNYADRKE